MKVKQLIAQLKKLPQDADVYTRDHDQGEYQTNSPVRGAEVCMKKFYTRDYEVLMTPMERDSFDRMPRRWVTVGV